MCEESVALATERSAAGRATEHLQIILFEKPSEQTTFCNVYFFATRFNTTPADQVEGQFFCPGQPGWGGAAASTAECDLCFVLLGVSFTWCYLYFICYDELLYHLTYLL